MLEVLREPLESGRISVSRAARQAEFAAQFPLVAAMNRCACGHLGTSLCRCNPEQVLRYRRRISGPLLDRIDIQIEVPAVSADELSRMKCGERSAAVRERVIAARERMIARQGTENARIGAPEVEKFCLPDVQGEILLKQAAQRFGISARGYHRILMVARTIADLAASDKLTSAHVGEAVQYRKLERPPS